MKATRAIPILSAVIASVIGAAVATDQFPRALEAHDFGKRLISVEDDVIAESQASAG